MLSRISKCQHAKLRWFTLHRVAKSHPFRWTPPYFRKILYRNQWNGTNYFLKSYLNCAFIFKYGVCCFKRQFNKSIKSQFVVKTVKQHLVFVKPLSELRLSSRTIYITNANMAVTLAQFLWFLQNEGKWIKRGKNHYKHEHIESCHSANTELVTSVRDRC